MAARLKIKPWPFITVVVALVLSIALAVFIWPGMDTDAMLPFAIAGYVLTPFVAALCLFAARRMDLNYQGNPLYLRLDGRQKIKLIGLIVAFSFIPASIHIWYIAGFVGSWLA